MDLPPPKADFSAPPPYELVTNSGGNGDQTESTVPGQENPVLYVNLPSSPDAVTPVQIPPSQDAPIPPPPSAVIHNDSPPGVHTKLPTYEEVQMEKTRLGEMPLDLTQQTFPIHGRIPPPSHPVLISALRNAHGQATFITIESGAGGVGGTGPDGQPRSHGRGATELTPADVDNTLLGTDFMFLAAFIVAFLFNWIGFLMLTCFFHTIAARYGALSGFGLSLAKWTLIVKKSTDLASHESSWLWWLIMSFGCLICVRALVQYVSIKRTWRMMSASAQERLLFFY